MRVNIGRYSILINPIHSRTVKEILQDEINDLEFCLDELVSKAARNPPFSNGE
jgi:hypothetical protein